MTYLDHAATTRVLPQVIQRMSEVMVQTGNASSLHKSGREARKTVEIAREQVADALHCLPSEVIFTAGGTESDNLAVKGLYWLRHNSDPRRTRILTSAIEHHAVLDPLVWLDESEGAEVEWIEVDSLGRINLEALKASIEKDPESVALVSVMWANNEVGTIQPIHEIVEIAHQYSIPVHSDAVQVVGWLPIDFAASGIDALTLSGHKIGGPMGVGALLLRREFKPVPVLHGGGQEREVRSGTLATHLIAGLGIAVEDAVAHQAERAERITALRNSLIERVLANVPAAHLNGDLVNRLPGNAHFSFEGCEGDALLMLLDAAGVESSTGSACTAGIPQPSHVLLAMGVPVSTAVGSLRFSLGSSSVEADVDALIDVLPGVVERAQRAGKTARSS
ncbi:MAG: hypothetical protein RIS75_887 [Actinomycetota bacterium]|jgi:cysteine desulfurase